MCYNAAWIERIPKLSAIQVDELETEPVTDEEYEKILKAATGRTRTLIKLMRWSGLAIRDASTLKREDLQFDKQKRLYKVIPERTKTGEALDIPIPKDLAKELMKGWQQIAAYLSHPAAVVQRWASEGMPARRQGRS